MATPVSRSAKDQLGVLAGDDVKRRDQAFEGDAAALALTDRGKVAITGDQLFEGDAAAVALVDRARSVRARVGAKDVVAPSAADTAKLKITGDTTPPGKAGRLALLRKSWV